MRGTKHEWAPGRWRLRVYVEGKQVSQNFKGSARDADRALRRFVDEIEDGRYRQDHPSVAELLERWLTHLEQTGRARPYTIAQYRYTINAAINPALGSRPVDKLTAFHLDQQYSQWISEGVSPSTVLKRHRILSAALKQAAKWEIVPRAVTTLATPPSAEDPEPRAMSSDEIVALIKTAGETDPILETAIALASATGMRRGELCGLRWADWDERGILTIARSITATGGQWHEGQTKTRRVRRISVGSYGQIVLYQRLKFQEKLAADAGTKMVANPWILSRRADAGEPVMPNGLTHAFRRLANKLDMPYHFHELRHWAATTALVDGNDPRTVAGRLGHSNPQITMRIYAKFIESADQKVAESLGRALSPQLGLDGLHVGVDLGQVERVPLDSLALGGSLRVAVEDKSQRVVDGVVDGRFDGL